MRQRPWRPWRASCLRLRRNLREEIPNCNRRVEILGLPLAELEITLRHDVAAAVYGIEHDQGRAAGAPRLLLDEGGVGRILVRQTLDRGRCSNAVELGPIFTSGVGRQHGPERGESEHDIAA